MISKIGMWGDNAVYEIVLKNKHNHTIKILSIGATVTEWIVPDRNGLHDNIILGLSSWDRYLKPHPFFGSIVGRFANRIAQGELIIEGHMYSLEKNLGHHHLHGGNDNWSFKNWEIIACKENFSVTLQYVSPHLDNGYPGKVTCEVTYTLSDEGELSIAYDAHTDRTTVINITNHMYFNLSGKPWQPIFDHQISIFSHQITATDEDLIPTGVIEDISHSALDFRHPMTLSDIWDLNDPHIKIAKGFDHNFVLPRPAQLNQSIATLCHFNTGRKIMVYTDQPGIQLYTGNWLGGVDTGSYILEDYTGLCLETQHFPDSPHHPHFPSTTLNPHERFSSITRYTFSLMENES